MRVRDTQRERVYLAEGSTGMWDDPKFNSFEDFCEFIRECMQTGLIVETYPQFVEFDGAGNGQKGSINLHLKNKNSKRSTATVYGINIAPSQFLKQVALHELAHTITKREYGGLDEGHGWRWCSVYIKLVGWFLGLSRRDALIQAFDERGIQYTERKILPRWKAVGVGGAA